GTVNQIDTWSYGAFKKNPYPDLARGLIDYFMQPANYDKIIQSTGGRWVPVYKRLFDSPFWREKPEFRHFINMAETGVPVSYAGAPTPAAGEVLNTHVIPKMIQRVLVDGWEPAGRRPRRSRSATSASSRFTLDITRRDRRRPRRVQLLRWRPRPSLRRMRHTPQSGLGHRLACGPFSAACSPLNWLPVRA